MGWINLYFSKRFLNFETFLDDSPNQNESSILFGWRHVIFYANQNANRIGRADH